MPLQAVTADIHGTARKAVRRKLDGATFPWATFHTLQRTVERSSFHYPPERTNLLIT